MEDNKTKLRENIRKIFRNPTSIPNRIMIYLGVHQDSGITYQTTMAKELKIPVTTLNYWNTKFKQEGLLHFQKSPIKLTDLGIKTFKYLWDNSGKTILRAHNIQVKFNVIKCNWNSICSNEIYEPLTNKKYKGIKTKLSGFTVMFYSPKKIVCVLPDVYADNDEEIASCVMLMVKDVKSIIQSEFNCVLGTTEIAKIQSMHIAVLNSNIAKSYLLTGFTKETNEYSIDNSHGVPEVELTNPATALANIKDLIKLDEDYNGNKSK